MTQDNNNSDITNKQIKDKRKVQWETLKKIEADIQKLETNTAEKNNHINKIEQDFRSEVLGNDEGKNSEDEDAILPDIKDTQEEITKYYNEIFDESDDEGTEPGIKEKIESFYGGIENKATEAQSKLEEAQNTVDNINEKSSQAAESNTQITAHLTTVQNTVNSISQQESKAQDLKNNIEKQNKEIEEIVENRKSEIDAQNKEVKELVESRKTEIDAQNKEIEELKKTLRKLQYESQKLLEGVTDGTLHEAFKVQAEKKARAHKIYFWASLIILGIAVGTIMYIILETETPTTPSGIINTWLTRLSLSIPLAIGYWLCSKKSDITLKLAEEYQHKASITQALSGYRKLWKLEHDHHEYKEFFIPTVKSIIKNPAESLKFSNKDITDPITDTVKAVTNPNKDNSTKNKSQSTQSRTPPQMSSKPESNQSYTHQNQEQGNYTAHQQGEGEQETNEQNEA